MKIKVAVIIALVVSWCITGFAIFSKGIHIHNTYHQEQYQNQSQAQLIKNNLHFQGNWELEVKVIKGSLGDTYAAYKQAFDFLKTLNPMEYTEAKIYDNGSIVYIVYPKIPIEWSKK